MWTRLPRALFYLHNCRFAFIAAGVLLAFFDRRCSDRIRALFQESGPFLSAFLIVLPLGLVTLCENPSDAAPRLLHGFAIPFSLACFSLLVLLAANGLAFPRGGGRLRRLMVYLGDRSYTLYLFHPPAMILAFVIAQEIHVLGILRSGLALGHRASWHAVAVMLPFCHLIYRFVEMPCIRLGKRLTTTAGHAPRSPLGHTVEPAPEDPEVPRKLVA